MEDSTIRILVIDTDEANRQTVSGLARDGKTLYDCVYAGSVAESKPILRSQNFDAIIVAYVLPDGTAFNVLPWVSSDTAVVMATESGDWRIAIQAMKAGVSDYLEKKPHKDYLKALSISIETAVRAKRTERDLRHVKEELEKRVAERSTELKNMNELLLAEISERKRAEEKYRGIFEHAVEGIFQSTPEGRFVEANPATARILGYDSPEELMEAVSDIPSELYVNPRRQEEFVRLLLEEEVVHGFEVEMHRRDGSRIWVSFHARPVYDDQGKLVLVEGIVDDVTERRRAEKALWESHRRFRALFATSPDPMVVHRGGHILFGNTAAAEFFGVSTTEALVGRDVVEFIHPDFKAMVEERITEAQKGRRATKFMEVKFVRLDGTIGYLESTAVPTTYKGERAVLSMGRDITERKLAEFALKESEARFRAIFESARDCIFIKDLDRRYTHVNPAVESLFGIPARGVVGRRAENFFGKESAKDIRETDLRILSGESIDGEHSRLIRGVPYTFHDIKTPLWDSSGRIVGICGISRDITDRKKAEPLSSVMVREYPSRAMQATLEQARYAAASDGIVLLLGESGTGKDHLARWIHSKSERGSGPFFAVNCAAVSKELAESEFFGHERGAFTGALSRKRGLLELAEGGTLLLNEIGELSLTLQSKLLTFLDTRSFTRVGGEKSVRVSARLIAATHRNIETEVAEGRFLEPLYYRLNVFSVHVPPLRDRIEDIPVLVEAIMAQLARELRLSRVPQFDREQIASLASYLWPGNVRELRNVLERSIMLSDSEKPRLIMPFLKSDTDNWSYQIQFPENRTLLDVADDVMRALCLEALRRSGGNKKDAAASLGISRHSLYRYMNKYRLDTIMDF